ncbi:AraC family transcriptional regulator [Leifsonia sp. NPDC056665]|uniref:AraC family transcriptional regulator n=1 Tax=Leifsonia sp. NPDC056665 TaxID=3345901 RepID=UPI00368F2A05
MSASGYQTYRSADVDEAVELASRVLSYDHRVTPVRAGAPFAWEVSGFALGSVRLARMSYGGRVDVEMQSHSDAYGISAPSAGLLNVRTGRREVTATPEFAAVRGPDLESAISGFEQPDDRLTMVRIDRRTLERELGRIINDEVTAPIDFAPLLDLRTGRAAEWWQLVQTLYRSGGSPDGLAGNPLVSAHVAGLLTTGLLLATEHRYRAALEQDAAPAMPAVIRRAMDFIDENAGLPITVTDVAAAVGASARTLQRGFREHAGSSTLAYLARVRLENAHQELRRSGPETATVAAIAARWGFSNLGRFAARYRTVYGVLPGEALRQP